MSCGSVCVTPSPAQAHCGACHETFGGVSLFDRHRREGVCLRPMALGAEARSGVWRIPATPEERQRLSGLRSEVGDDD